MECGASGSGMMGQHDALLFINQVTIEKQQRDTQVIKFMNDF